MVTFVTKTGVQKKNKIVKWATIVSSNLHSVVDMSQSNDTIIHYYYYSKFPWKQLQMQSPAKIAAMYSFIMKKAALELDLSELDIFTSNWLGCS